MSGNTAKYNGCDSYEAESKARGISSHESVKHQSPDSASSRKNKSIKNTFKKPLGIDSPTGFDLKRTKGLALDRSSSLLSGPDDKSRFPSQRDISLPPKAEKYRIRSTADGETTLSPFNHRQLALAAINPCASEVSSLVEISSARKSDLVKCNEAEKYSSVKGEKAISSDNFVSQNSLKRFHGPNSEAQVMHKKTNGLQIHNLMSSELAIAKSERKLSMGGSELKVKQYSEVAVSLKKLETGKVVERRVNSMDKSESKSRAMSKNIPHHEGSFEEVAHETIRTHQDQVLKQPIVSHFGATILSRMPSDTKSTMNDINNSGLRGRSENLGASKVQLESSTNKVRAA